MVRYDACPPPGKIECVTVAIVFLGGLQAEEWEWVEQQNGSEFVGALLDKGGGIGQGGRGFGR